MKSYLVLGADGNRYGPADEAMLANWAREGRIVAGTILIDALSNEQTTANRLPLLRDALIAERPRPAAFDVTQTAAGRGPGLPPIPPQAHPVAGYPQPVMNYGAAVQPGVGPKSKVVAGLLGIFLGGIGAHRFYLGFIGVGLLILLSNVACGIGFLWGMIEGILCLAGKMRDSEGRLLRD